MGFFLVPFSAASQLGLLCQPEGKSKAKLPLAGEHPKVTVLPMLGEEQPTSQKAGWCDFSSASRRPIAKDRHDWPLTVCYINTEI